MRERISGDKEVIIGLDAYSFSLPPGHEGVLDTVKETLTLEDEHGRKGTWKLKARPDPSKPYDLYELGEHLAGGVEGDIYAIVTAEQERALLVKQWVAQGRDRADYFARKSREGLSGRAEFDTIRAELRSWPAP